MKYYCGIDIGANGGIVILNENNECVLKSVIPKIDTEIDLVSLKKILLFYKDKNIIVGFENLRSIFGVSASANFTFGFNCGVTEAIVSSLEMPYLKIYSKIWQKEAFIGIKEIRKPSKFDKNGKEKLGSLETKKMALIASNRLYPGLDLKATERSKKQHEGMVDALLISWYLIQKKYV